MTKKTPIAQRRPFPIEYPRFWESKKTQRAATIGTKKRRISKKSTPEEMASGSEGKPQNLKKEACAGKDSFLGPLDLALGRYLFRLS